MPRPPRSAATADERISLRLSKSGRADIRRRVTERAEAEGRQIGNGQDHMSEGVIVRRMLAYAAKHMPADYGSTPVKEGRTK